jgi:hypothetical protein
MSGAGIKKKISPFALHTTPIDIFSSSHCNNFHIVPSCPVGRTKRKLGGENMPLSMRADTIFGAFIRGTVLAVVLGLLLFGILVPILARALVRPGWL